MQHAEASRVTYVAQQWLSATLPAFHDTVKVEKLEHGVLTIGCAHSVAAQECQFLMPVLLAHLQRECGPQALTEARVVRLRANGA
ncbi:MAG: hypothetical protein Greene041619_1085 [Candidatus Peregrinibacteria bacterium Greene0416_19]|nr:MAG: hypothetical protein Greene041619_1085 [Candidatus Peregrinibacteria bacterium Greene0416_19]